MNGRGTEFHVQCLVSLLLISRRTEIRNDIAKGQRYSYETSAIFSLSRGTEWHKKTGTFEKPNKNWRNPRKKIYWQKLNHYNLPF